MTRRSWILLGVLLVLLQIADGVLTWYTVDLGLANEGNPIALRLIKTYGLAPALFILKTVCIKLIVVLFGIFYLIYRMKMSSWLLNLVKITIIMCIMTSGYDVMTWLIFVLNKN